MVCLQGEYPLGIGTSRNGFAQAFGNGLCVSVIGPRLIHPRSEFDETWPYHPRTGCAENVSGLDLMCQDLCLGVPGKGLAIRCKWLNYNPPEPATSA